MKKLLGILVLGLLLCSSANSGYKEGRQFFEFAKHVNGTTIYKGSSTKLEYAEDGALMKCRSRDPYAESDPDGCILVDKTGIPITETKKKEKKETKKKEKNRIQKKIPMDKCKELGFVKGTEDFSDCVTIMLSKQ